MKEVEVGLGRVLVSAGIRTEKGYRLESPTRVARSIFNNADRAVRLMDDANPVLIEVWGHMIEDWRNALDLAWWLSGDQYNAQESVKGEK